MKIVLFTTALLAVMNAVPLGAVALGPTAGPLAADEPPPPFVPAEPMKTVEEREAHLLPPAPREHSKKEAWLREKTWRRDVHLDDDDLARARKPRPMAKAKAAAEDPLAAATPVGARAEPLTTLFNLRTRESLPLLPGFAVEEHFHRFLRDHFTNQATRMDERLIGVLSRVAKRFDASRIEVVSGYRSPKYNLMLRKKGRQVARTSQHVEGHAVDFRVRGVPTRAVLNFVRSLRIGGVGYYPHSQFVHSDTGPIRFWKGS